MSKVTLDAFTKAAIRLAETRNQAPGFGPSGSDASEYAWQGAPFNDDLSMTLEFLALLNEEILKEQPTPIVVGSDARFMRSKDK